MQDTKSDNLQFKSENEKWISSEELLSKCDISRSTLNNYIKVGIVPRPNIIKNADESLVVCFPIGVVDIVNKVKRARDEGETMEEIIKRMKEQQADDHSVQIDKKNTLLDEKVKKILEIGGNGLRLTLEDLRTPAYLLNYQFEIEWINAQAEESIFGKSIKTIRDVEYRNVFRLFLNWEFSHFIKNWEEFLNYHMTFFRAKSKKENIDSLYTGISGKEVDYLQKAFDKAKDIPMEKIYQQPVTVAEKGKPEEKYVTYTTFFREGMFFLYLSADNVPEGITEYLSNREMVVRDLLQKRLPTLVSFSVLVADLQSSVRICAELQPEEYFELINSMWRLLEESFKKFNGIFGKRIGDGVVYYFLKKQDPNYIMNSINCALEIRERMERFSSEWKIRKKWINDLYLNMGINEGREYFSTTTPSSTNVEFTALGDTINYASRLSNLARFGSIITTKNLMNELTEENRNTLRFGVTKRIHDRDVFVEKVFSRVVDLASGDDTSKQRFVDIAALPVTEIIG